MRKSDLQPFILFDLAMRAMVRKMKGRLRLPSLRANPAAEKLGMCSDKGENRPSGPKEVAEKGACSSAKLSRG